MDPTYAEDIKSCKKLRKAGLTMGFFEWINNRRGMRREKKEERKYNEFVRFLNMAKSKGYQYNPKYYTDLTLGITPEQEFTLSIAENYAWFTGKANRIRSFYRQNLQLLNDLNYFWAKAPVNYRKVHSGLPSLISHKMSTIIYGGGFSNEITIYKVDEEGNYTDEIDREKSKEAMDNLEVLKDKSVLKSRLIEGATIGSWCGHSFFKIGYDLEASNYPIVEVADLRNAEVIKRRGLTVGIAFKNYYQKGDQHYVHKEIYTTTDEDDAVIINELYLLNTTKGEVLVDLTTLDETKDLEREIIFNGLKGMLAFEIPNKLPNNAFPESNYGASDYVNAVDAFDALDEVMSEIVMEVRNNKSKRLIPSTMVQYLRDEKGNIQIGDIDPFLTNYLLVDGDPDQNAKNEVVITEIKDKMESLQEKWKIAITTALNAVGLSPFAIGITGIESISASEKSQQERNKATLETRNAKLEVIQPFLENLLFQLLAFNSWMQTNVPNLEQKDLNETDIDYSNCRVSVMFGDYISETIKDKIDTWSRAKETGGASTLTYVKKIREELSQSEIDEEVNLIRYEQGMALDNPLNLPELTGLILDDDEEEAEEEQEEVSNS